MRRHLVTLSLLCLALAACADNPVTQFWRPISEPNLLMPSDQLQTKLSFDLNQCHCGSYPATATRDEMVKFNPDKQRLVETGVTIMPDEAGQCLQQPSLVVTECMRQRGWEPTNCSGRVPLPGGGSLCTTYTQPDNQ